jgi:hypothetical protein
MFKNKFFLPASSMLASLLVWAVFLVLHETGRTHGGRPLWLDVGLCLLAALLMVFSAYICRHVRGPRVGNFIRTVLLAIMAAITGLRAGIAETVVLAFAAIVVGVVALMKSKLNN